MRGVDVGVGVHVPGRSWLHRLPAGAKLLGLAALSLALLAVDDPRLALAAAGAAVVVLLCAGVAARRLWRVVRWPLALLLALAVLEALALGRAPAALLTGRLLATVALAWAVSLTTPVTAMLDALVRALRPLRPLGVDAERVGLTLALAIRSVPLIVDAVHAADEARLARGRPASVSALVVPVVVRTVRHADALGEALIARGHDA